MTTNDTSDSERLRSYGLWLILLFLVMILGGIILVRVHDVGGNNDEWQVRRTIGRDILSHIQDCGRWIGRIIPAKTGCSRRNNVASNMRQILMVAISYGVDTEPVWTWPLDLPAIKAYSDGELPDKVFRDSRWPTDPDPFIYVRPSSTAKSAQPVLFSRPTTGRNPTVIVGYADGHIAYVPGTALFFEAHRLAGLRKARNAGIEGVDWVTLPELRPSAATPSQQKGPGQIPIGVMPPAAVP